MLHNNVHFLLRYLKDNFDTLWLLLYLVLNRKRGVMHHLSQLINERVNLLVFLCLCHNFVGLNVILDLFQNFFYFVGTPNTRFADVLQYST